MQVGVLMFVTDYSLPVTELAWAMQECASVAVAIPHGR